MKKTKCMGTSKNKRAMSGGRGKIGKYTQKFKRSYKRFVKIGDTGDDESRFKKMDEWGRMRNIYNFLKIQNDKYKGSAGTETTAWEKMKDNDYYKSAISCFDEIDNHILSKGECIPEEDYMKGDTGGTPTVIAEASNNDTPVADDEAPASEVSGKTENTNENAAVETDANTEVTPVVDTVGQPEAEADTENAAGETEAPASEVSDTGETEAPADVSSDSESSNTGETEATPKVSSASDVSNDAADTAPTVDDTASQATTTDAVNTDNAAGETEANPEVFSASDVSDDAKNDNKADADADEAPADVSSTSESSTSEVSSASDVSDDAKNDNKADADADEAPATDVPADAHEQRDSQGGGRSKRRQKSSRRRGKSMKSKKGRKTRRKHRAGRH